MSKGWIKLHRSIVDHPRFQDQKWLIVWIRCLTLATHKPHSALFAGQVIELQKGQFITSRKSLSEKTGVSESTVERILKTLETEQQIEQRSSSVSRLITVTNWIQYQDGEQEDGQRADSGRTAGGQRADTNKNDKKGKEGEEVRDPHAPGRAFFDVARKAYPGDKRGLDSEWANFKSKNPNYSESLPLLLPAIEKEIEHKAKLKATPGAFCPPWAMFSTWINQKRWTQEFGEVSNGINRQHPQQFKSAHERKEDRWRDALGIKPKGDNPAPTDVVLSGLPPGGFLAGAPGNGNRLGHEGLGRNPHQPD